MPADIDLGRDPGTQGCISAALNRSRAATEDDTLFKAWTKTRRSGAGGAGGLQGAEGLQSRCGILH